jgi:hypothetical protein
MDKLNGRKVYIPRGRDKQEDLNILADCIAASDADLFNDNDCLIWIAAGGRVPVTPEILRGICTKYVVTKHARETPDGWKVEYRPVEPDEMVLRTLLMAKSREAGSLLLRVPKGLSEPARLSERHRQEVRDRLKIGEPKDKLAREYGVGVDVIRELAR